MERFTSNAQQRRLEMLRAEQLKPLLSPENVKEAINMEDEVDWEEIESDDGHRELYEDDGQPDEYTEWQDYMGGDDWDQGQYDHAEYEWDCDLHGEY
jgi:hypothetical protein